jgi:flagellar L-ring protein FlgH
MRIAGIAFTLAAALFAGGCAQLANTPKVDMPSTTTPPQLESPSANAHPPTGSLFHSVSYRPLFEDRRAHMVGDNVTILIVENVSASQTSTSTIDKKSGLDMSVSALPFFSPNSFNRASAKSDSSNTFAGKGGTQSANTFQGAITATVTEVLPNGHLVVAGEKQIGVNQNVDVLRFTGTIDPRAIQAGSTVSSIQVANVRIESRGRGAQQESQVMPWLGRFFMSVLPF